jgi:hypothetical protein
MLAARLERPKPVTLNQPPYEIAEPEREPLARERIMCTSMELVDRAIEIEWATSLKHKRRSTMEHALGLLIAEWAATWGPWACFRILRVALRAMIHPVWKSRGTRRKRRLMQIAGSTLPPSR